MRISQGVTRHPSHPTLRPRLYLSTKRIYIEVLKDRKSLTVILYIHTNGKSCSCLWFPWYTHRLSCIESKGPWTIMLLERCGHRSLNRVSARDFKCYNCTASFQTAVSSKVSGLPFVLSRDGKEKCWCLDAIKKRVRMVLYEPLRFFLTLKITRSKFFVKN